MSDTIKPKVRQLDTLDTIEVAGVTIGQFIGQGEANRLTVVRVTTSRENPFPRTLHKEAEEVIHVLSGRGRVVIDEHTYPVSAGSLIFIPAGAVHHLEADSGELTALAFLAPPVYKDRDLYIVEQ